MDIGVFEICGRVGGKLARIGSNGLISSILGCDVVSILCSFGQASNGEAIAISSLLSILSRAIAITTRSKSDVK